MAKIAIIDDSQIVLAVTCDALEEEGHETLPIDTPIGATMRLSQSKPDLILVDLKMASLSGEQVVRGIKKSARLTEATVILFSGEGESDLMEAMKRCGADGYFRKTDDSKALIRAVTHWLRDKPTGG